MTRKAEGPTIGGDKPLPEAGQVIDHKAHLLSRSATPKVKLLCKIENKQ
jgi:hypothetical protein